MGGLQKLRTVLGRFDPYKGGVRIKFIIYHICIKTMSLKRGVMALETYEAKKIKNKNCYVNKWDRHRFYTYMYYSPRYNITLCAYIRKHIDTQMVAPAD